MPTYHLANIIDDHLMKITHVIRGEEWLSSTAHHVLMYRFFGWEAPTFTHLPLILKPTGKGKLSKRDGAKFGFPVFPLLWKGEEDFDGFREAGFDPDALLNFLVLLGWNPGNDEEIMSRDRMVELFSLEKIVKSGARFDIDKARWFNQQYIMKADNEALLAPVKAALPEAILQKYDDKYLTSVIALMKERVQNYNDFYNEGQYMFEAPLSYDDKQVQKRFDTALTPHFDNLLALIIQEGDNAVGMSESVKGYLNEKNLKMGVFLPLLRIMMCGSMTGPDLFELMVLLGGVEVRLRWEKAMRHFESL
jgi:glutamyl-tRNA synthetase